VAGGALPMSAGASFHGRRKPNGSACQRRTMAGVQDEAKHAISAMSPLKSCDVEKPRPSGRCRTRRWCWSPPLCSRHARSRPRTARRPGRHVPKTVDQVVSVLTLRPRPRWACVRCRLRSAPRGRGGPPQ
jgi:hypothetical protein